jgi:hypothetical protein
LSLPCSLLFRIFFDLDPPEAVLKSGHQQLSSPKQLGNLKPTDNTRQNGYAGNYAPVFSTSKTLLSGVLLAGVDQQIAAANATFSRFSPAPRKLPIKRGA